MNVKFLTEDQSLEAVGIPECRVRCGCGGTIGADPQQGEEGAWRVRSPAAAGLFGAVKKPVGSRLDQVIRRCHNRSAVKGTLEAATVTDVKEKKQKDKSINSLVFYFDMHSTIYARRPAQYSCFVHAVILSEPPPLLGWQVSRKTRTIFSGGRCSPPTYQITDHEKSFLSGNGSRAYFVWEFSGCAADGREQGKKKKS